MLRAFDVIFIGAGIGRFITNINNKIRSNKNGS